MNTADTPSGTLVHAPDLSWSQVRETVLLLQLAMGQIEAALTESHSSVAVLTESFTAMAGYIGALNDALADAAPVEQPPDDLKNTAAQLTGMVNQAIVAFQFYDKLTQRIGHVSESLDGLSALVGDQRRLFNPQEWASLQQAIRSKYTTAEEREMFDAVINGMPVQQALQHFVSEMKNKGDDIEFF
ncbi:hypothetical protein [Methylogaea oryzae]|uniref:Chemotaxis protein n=1 Tax=Methylogaea oryzae TaxID=1295382 RepID=A0A8D4VMG0_9GAMM|nr:hypothetical protein [Methylogaea oryzae]BBL70535.1 hypothetical protein MoryE10_11410 [Methylogaea oryzae]